MAVLIKNDWFLFYYTIYVAKHILPVRKYEEHQVYVPVYDEAITGRIY